MVAAGVCPADMVEVGGDALRGMFEYWGAELADARARGDVTAAFGHTNIIGAVSSTGQPQAGRDVEIDGAMLALLGDIYKGWNHIHKGQSIFGAHFAGSIAPQDNGEIEPKRALVADIADDSSYVLSEIPLNIAALWHVEGDLTRDGFTWEATAGPGGERQEPPATWDGQDVRVRYTYDAALSDVLDFSLVKAPFVGARRIAEDPVAKRTRAVRAPEVAAARTLDEKFLAWCGVTNHVAKEGVLAKLSLLQGDLDAVTGTVRTQVDDLTRFDVPVQDTASPSMQEALL